MNQEMNIKLQIISIMIITLFFCGCRRGGIEKVEPEAKKQAMVKRVILGDIFKTLNLTGEVMPLSSVILTSKVPGRLEQLAIKDTSGQHQAVVEGTKVYKGQQLCVIDYATYSARARQAEAVVAAARAQFEDTAREEKRAVALFKDGATTQQFRDKSITERQRSEAVLQQTEAALELAKIDLDEATPASPIDGIVVTKHIDEGNIVSSGMPIVTIQDISSVKILFSLPERYLFHVIPGETTVRLSSDALGNAFITGTVERIYPALDRVSRTAKVEVLVDNTDTCLRPGMFMRIELVVKCKQKISLVPNVALLREGDEVFVYRIKDAKAYYTPVKLGICQSNLTEVVSGLAEGDFVVIGGQRMLKDGDKVEIIKKEPE